MDSQHYNAYHHAYYRVGSGIKDHQMHLNHMANLQPDPQTSVVQSRILELRKEKSRDAARSRRGKENHEFYELAKMLPLPSEITSQSDKASIIRLTISYLKLRDFASNGFPTWTLSNYNQLYSSTNSALKNNKICNAFDNYQGIHILQALDGFVFALGQDGRFLYVSETVSVYLGLSQVDLTGSSIFDYCHQDDHAELALHLGLTNNVLNSNKKSPSLNGKLQQNNFNHINGNSTNSCSPLPPASVCSNGSSADSDPTFQSSHFNSTSSMFYGNQSLFANSEDKLERQFCIRMKSTLAKRGCQHFKSNGYRVIHVNAQLRPEYNTEQQRLLRSNIDLNNSDSSSNNNIKLLGLVAVAIALPPPSINELRLEPDMFVMKLSLDLRIIHCEPKVNELLDYNAEELLSRNFYGLVHCFDMGKIRKAHLDLIHKGQVMTKYYRIINKNGGYTWIQSCATLISNSTQQTSTPTSSNPANSNTNTPSPLLNTNANSPNSATSNSNTGTGVSLNSSTSTTNNEEQVDQSIILINYVISGLEAENIILDSSQLPDSHQKVKQQRTVSKLQLTHSPPSPSAIQPPTKKMISCKRQSSISLQNTNSLASPADSQTNSNNNNLNLCSMKRSPNSPSPCQSPTINLRHNQLLPIHHNSSNSDEDTPCNNENNHNTINSVEIPAGVDLKRRRYLSSPVRPWKSSPSPLSNSHLNSVTVSTAETNMTTSSLLNTQHLLLNNGCQMNNSQNHSSILHNQQCNLNPLILNSNLNCSSPESASSSSSLNGSSSMTLPNSSSLLRHISVIRETPPVVLKSQLVQHYPHHQQNYSIHHHSNHSHHLNNNHSLHHSQLMNNHLLDQHQQLTHDLANQLNSNSHNALNISTNGINLSHNNSSPVEHIGQTMNLAIGSNNMSHLSQQSTSATVPSTTLLTTAMPVVSNQSTYHHHSTSSNTVSSSSNQLSNSIHHSLNNHPIHTSSEIQPQALNTSSNHSTALMHQAAAVAAVTHPLAANVNPHVHHHHSALTHSNHHYTNPLTNPLNQLNHHSTHHHHSLVDPYSSYSSSTAAAAAAAAAALHQHWTAYN